MAAENQEQYRQVSGNLTQKSHDLAQITDQLDRVKHEMEERGSSMTDGSKLALVTCIKLDCRLYYTLFGDHANGLHGTEGRLGQ